MSDVAIPRSWPRVADLNNPIRVYGHRQATQRTRVALCMIGFLVAIGLAAFGLIHYDLSPGSEGVVGIVMVLVAVGFLLGTLYLAWYTISRWNETAVLYRNGFAYRYRGRVHATKWTDIVSITMQVAQPSENLMVSAISTNNYYVVDSSGNRMKLGDSLPRVTELVEHIRKETFPHILDHTRHTLESGETVKFGPISVNYAKGLCRGKKCHDWSDIGDVTQNRGRIQIIPEKSGAFRKFGVEVAKIPNIDVLLAIIAAQVEKCRAERDGRSGIQAEMADRSELSVGDTIHIAQIEERLKLERRCKLGASAFFWIAGLSFFNSLAWHFGFSLYFPVGLGISQVVDAVATLSVAELGQGVALTAIIIALIINALVTGFFVLIGVFARAGRGWSFAVGTILYALDGLVLLVFGDAIGLVFHGIMLVGVILGWRAHSKLREMMETA